MPATVTVLYPPGDFNLDYYKTSHMPMVAKEFAAFGFKGYRVVQYTATPDPSTPTPYQVAAHLEFENSDGFHSALQAKGGVVLGDIPNFTNTQPVLIIGEEVAQA